MERRLKCGVCAAAALALVLCFGMEQKNSCNADGRERSNHARH